MGSASSRRLERGDVRAHVRAARPDRTVAGRIDAHVANGELGARDDGTGNEEEGRRGDICPEPTTSTARSVPPAGSSVMRAAVGVHAATPSARSMRSVWSREGAGSMTVVGASAYRPASRMALFELSAMATGRRVFDAVQLAPVRMVSGTELVVHRRSMAAPIWRSGFMTRPIGRFWMDGSPLMVTVNG